MKKIILLMLVLVASVFSASGADFYSVFDFTYTDAPANSVYVTGGECQDNSCSSLGQGIEIFSGNAITCWNTFAPSGDSVGFENCMEGYRITNNIVNTDSVIVKQNIPSDFGYNMYFFAEDDEYIVQFFRMTNYQCESDICFDTNHKGISFEKKANAIAEVGQLNIKNIDNPNLPVQVEVPVSIEETVCSAFKFTQPNMYRPAPPQGYSDYSANTLVNLVISNANTNQQYADQSITIPIEADTCAGLAAFSWTPDSSLENEDIKFRVDTDVIDNQVSSSIPDWAEVIETIYPENLDGACWTRAYDFTLSNVATQDLNTSIAQITQGESLYALFTAGAFRDETMTPMDFETIVQFDGTTVYDQLLNSGEDLQTYTLDLSSSILGLDAGSYDVTLITRPVGTGCSILEDVTQTQNLELLAPEQFEAVFHVRDSELNALQGANINLELIDADDYYQTAPTYNQDILTNTNGIATFNQVIAGDYKYTVTKDGYVTVTNNVHIATNTDVYVTLPGGNVAPVINLPDEFTSFYRDTISVNLANYINDFNDDFVDLTVTYDNGGTNVVIDDSNYPILRLSTNMPNVGELNVQVIDPNGDIVQDSAVVNFINNQAPVVNDFTAEPDNGEEPFNTNFNIDVTDADGDALTCDLDFGDGTSTTGTCNGLNGIAHTYTNVGTFNAVLSISDGINDDVEAVEQVFVFNRTVDAPIINSFTLESSSGLILPSNLTLEWNVTHPANTPMTCTLRINGNSTDVPCIGSQEIENYNVTGVSRFHIIADDSTTQVIRTIEREFFTEAARLDGVNVELIMDDVVVPGEFTFNVSVTEEVLKDRLISARPAIICQGVRNTLPGDGLLATSAISSVDRETNTFEFRTDTGDFILNVPTDTLCTFEVTLTDNVSSRITLTKGVIFSYPEEELGILSIRGRGVDILNFMDTALASTIEPGFNTIEFTASNPFDDTREISVTIMSAELAIDSHTELSIGPQKERTVSVPIFIEEDTPAGLYPVRISVNNGEDKQTKYSYINIK